MTIEMSRSESNTFDVSILIVDDDKDIRSNVADILVDLGYDACTAGDGPQAMALVQQRGFDVALLDFRMPGMDGLTLYRKICQLRPGMAGLLITAYAADELTDEALQAGIRQVVRKPFDVPEILKTIAALAG